MVPNPQTDASAQRGTKRKRPEGGKTKAPPVKRETPGELIGKKLHHGLHEVRKAAKKAVAFELRKLIKRLKAARGEKPQKGNVKGDDPAELERQLEVLKHVDHEPFANTALKTKIMKDRLLSENEDVKAAVAEKLSENLVQPQEPGSSAAKVHGRLLSSKTIAEVVHTVVDSLRDIVDPSLAKAKARVQSQEAESSEEESDEEEEADVDVERPATKSKKARVAAPGDSDTENENEESGSEEEVDNAGWESGTVDGYEDGAGWESGSVDGGNYAMVGSSDESQDEDEDDDDDSEEDSAPPAKQPKTKPPAAPKDTKSKSKTIGAESTFLPSLSVGFTRGDSDASDLSDADAEAAAADMPRKNRRGQRARRAIWEKKYGKNANHVKKQHETSGAQNARQWGGGKGNNGKNQGQRQGQGRGPRDGAPPRGRPGAGQHGPGQRGNAGGPLPPPVDGGWPKRQAGAGGAGAGSGAGGKKSDDKPLHPSWEAKRKLKEKLNPSIIPAQGKKIKFS
ncbi:Bud-site selection protein [Pilatotrama ljubarskyi]|nr:Bud-site selection protein [Pilatotrama ljubarskyi]